MPARRLHTAARIFSAVVAAGSAMAGCGDSELTSTSAAPPTVVCDQTISNSAAGAVITDATRAGAITVDSVTADGVVVLRVGNDCRTGATVQITPQAAMRVEHQARTKDGRLAAIALQPRTVTADVVAKRPDGSTTTIHIRLANCAGTAPNTCH